jgi:mono/diheme cytochrome c family protein
MVTRWNLLGTALLLACSSIAIAHAGRTDLSSTVYAQAPDRPGGWTIPPTAPDEKNPLADDANALETGKQVFEKKCQKCHGPGGKGDGPDADPDQQQDMDLTVARRAARNPDGVVFYKIWNGRQKPKMPAQKNDLTKEQVWSVVKYVQTLRQKS